MKKVFEFTGNAAMLALFTIWLLEINADQRGNWRLEGVLVYPFLGVAFWKAGRFMVRLLFRKDTWVWLWKNLF